MLKKISIITLVLILLSALFIQYIYIKHLQNKYLVGHIEFGHARAIDAYQRVIELADIEGKNYALRAAIIGQTIETVRLEEWRKSNNIQLSPHTIKILDKTNDHSETKK
jgi:predicted Holliday junction resolvase-like endonuclease